MGTSYSFALEDRDGWKGHLKAHGFVGVRGVLTPSSASLAVDELWSLMEALGSVKRAVPSTWSRSASWPPMLHGGMIQYLGHTALQWRLREESAKLFAAYYERAETELVTSFDGLCMMHGARGYRGAGDLVSFLHCDQGMARKGEWSIQGLINLAESGAGDGGLVVVPDTHLDHEAFFNATEARRATTGDWYKLDEVEREAYRARALKVCGEPGEMLLWDSRTLHCNTVPSRREGVRACTYVCMLPRERADAKARAARAKGWRERRTSNHHPGEGFRLFPSLPRFGVSERDAFLGRVQALQRGFALTPLQESLRTGGDPLGANGNVAV